VDDELDWPFDQSPRTAAMTVRAVIEGAPILRVSHDEDDDGWQFLDGAPVEMEHAAVIGMAEALRLDPGLRELADLAPGWIARRSNPSEPWIREPQPETGS